MTEKVIKINEKLASKGKQLENVSAEEFDDIAQSVGLEASFGCEITSRRTCIGIIRTNLAHSLTRMFSPWACGSQVTDLQR